MASASDSNVAGVPAASSVVARGQPAPSADHDRALELGRALAIEEGRRPASLDALVGLLRSGGAAARLLGERGFDASRIEAVLNRTHPETNFDMDALRTTSVDIASQLEAAQTSSLHLLLAVLRAGGSATEALRLASYDPAKVRALVLRALTGPGPTSERRSIREPVVAKALPPPVPVQRTTGNRVSDQPSAKVQPEARPSPTDAGWDLAAMEPPRVPVLHRERETGRILDLLATKTPRIIAVIAEPGAGRTSLLGALGGATADRPLCPVGDLGGMSSAGLLLQALHRRAPLGSPIVLDGAAWLGPDGGDGPLQLVSTMNSGRRWILGLAPADLRRLELSAPELVPSLESVAVAPLAPAQLFEVVETGLGAMAEVCEVEFSADVCSALLRLSPRYPSDRAQPGRALSIAEVAVARATRLGRAQVSETDVADVVADASGVPAAQLLRNDDDRFRSLEVRLAERVVGHGDARAHIAAVLRRSYAGFRGRRPLASFLLLGPTGVGKTETARAIADALFDGESALVRIDLSEYSEPHSVARLIGSPPGYVAHEEGGQLTEALRRRPASVVLLDELEKAHREVLLTLLQVLEDGRLTDGRGRTVDFSAAAIVMTSNLGSECYRPHRMPAPPTILALARSRLPAELWNRIDEVLCYAPLGEAELGSIVARLAAESSRRLHSERGISFAIDETVVAHVLAAEPDRSLGARPLRRAFERMVEGPLANEIVAGRLRRGAQLHVSCDSRGRLLLRSRS